MRTVYIRDSNLFSEKYPERPCPYFKWQWLPNKQEVDILVLSDAHLVDVESSKSAVKIAWLMEPPVINSFIYEYVRKNYALFDHIFTFDESLLSVDPRFHFCPWGTTWIPENSRQVYPKTKNVSAIFSGKNWTDGHKLRHAVATQFKDQIDIMGRGYRIIESKSEGLIDYRYSVVIENSKVNSYFTEKIEDCFFTGTVPIFWGCTKIGGFFDLNGIITFDTVEDLGIILNNISEADYNSRMYSINHNFKKAVDYMYPEKYIAEFLV